MIRSTLLATVAVCLVMPALAADRLLIRDVTVISAERWKLNLYAHGQGELYNLNADPYELENLYDSPEHRVQVGNLAAWVRRWQEQTGDRVPLPNAL